MIPEGHGYYALTRHADISEASRHPEIFQSGQGATSIIDMPDEMLDFFGSMINMDNPRHARLRRIVSAAFNPRMIKSIEDRIELVANDVIDRVASSGGCDFVTEVAARLPLEIICDMMGIGPSDYDTVFNASNVILSNGDPEYVPEGHRPHGGVHDGGAAAQPVDAGPGRATARTTRPTTSPRRWSTRTSTARRSPTTRWRPSSSCWWWRATRRPATRSATGCWR